MKKSKQVDLSNSMVLEDDFAPLQPLNDTLSLDNDPIYNPSSQNQQTNVNFFDRLDNKIENDFILEDN